MRRLILSILLLFVAPVWAAYPPVLRLDQTIAPLELPAHVQVLYADTLGKVLVRVRIQASATDTPQNWCIAMQPSASPPPGVARFQWVSADANIVNNPAYGTLGPFLTTLCQTN
jgi:hypothetical protein